MEQNEQKEGIRRFPKHTENPFVKDMVIKKSDLKGSTVAISQHPLDVGSASGETAFIHLQKKVEKEQFIKLFSNYIKMIFDLSQCALKVFAYMCSSLEMNKDKFIFDINECKKFTGYSTNKTIITAKAELIEKGFMARTTLSNVYYINIKLFFNGDRLVVINDYYKDDSNNNIKQKNQKTIKLDNDNPNLFSDELPFS